MAEHHDVIIFTDSHYAYGVVHDFGIFWHERGFFTSSGIPIKNGVLIANLFEAISLPFAVAVKCDAHTGGSDDVSKGNARADEAAKAAANSSDSPTVKQCASTPSESTLTG